MARSARRVWKLCTGRRHGASGGLLPVGGVGALGLGDDAGALGGSGLVVGLIVEHRGEPRAHVMLDMIGEHA